MKKSIFAFILIFTLFLVGCGKNTNIKQEETQNSLKTNTVEAVRSSAECIGQDYHLIIDEFEKADFSNIRTEAIEDLLSAEAESVGTIESISIDGESTFSKGQSFDVESPILIRYHDYRNCTVSLHIDFNSNLIFNTYDVELWVDEFYKDTMSHGEDSDFEFLVQAGTHTFSFVNENDEEVDGEISLVIDGDTKLSYQIACYGENVVVREISTEILECVTSDHAWIEANCTEPNRCAVCGKTDGNALGHIWIEATCTSPKNCSICEETKGLPNGHAVSEWTELKAPTCGAVGVRTGFCDTCKEDVKEEIPATGAHVYSDWKTVLQPTCTAEGKKTKTCNNCQHKETDNIEMLSHDYVENIVSEATYYMAGTKGIQCSSCGDMGETTEYCIFYETSLRTIFDAYRSNEIAAKEKFDDMFVQFTAKIESIEQSNSLFSFGYINFEVDNGTLFEDDAKCKIKTSEQFEAAKKLRSGNYVTIKGKINYVREDTLNWIMSIDIIETG